MKRAQTFIVVVAANATEQQFTPSFNDKMFDQHFKEMFVGITTKGVVVTAYISGRPIASFDCSMFANSQSRAYFEGYVPANDQLTFTIKDTTGAGNAAVPVTFMYEIPNGADGTQP